MKVSILTLGCKVNQSESMIIEGNLIKHGCSIVGISEYPDYCIINTCTVTKKSDYQSRQLIRKAIRTGSKVIVTGCYAQLKPEDIQDIKGVTRIVYNNNKYSIINILTGIQSSYTYTYTYTSKSRPYIKVQDGCNFSCTYCVVPLARGKSKSTNISEVINQAIEFESLGYKEIVLTGIHLGSYGKDLKNNTNLSKLIKELLNKTRIPRIRLSSLEIKEINDEIIELIQDKRICRHLHLPLQSGDDRILNYMNRMYNTKEYEKTVK